MFSTQRIAIVGNSGSGKSMLSQALAHEYPITHIDTILWRPWWDFMSEQEFWEWHSTLIYSDSWVLDWIGYTSTLEARFARAQIVIFLDTSESTCMGRALERLEADRITPNPFISDGCRYAEKDKEQFETIQHFQQHTRPYILGLIDSLSYAHVLDGEKTPWELVDDLRTLWLIGI